MTWKDLCSFPNTRFTVVKDNCNLEEELRIAMDAIVPIEEMNYKDVPVAVEIELLTEEGKCEKFLFPMKWFEPQNELANQIGGFELCGGENVAARATIVFPQQIEWIVLVCESEFK